MKNNAIYLEIYKMHLSTFENEDKYQQQQKQLRMVESLHQIYQHQKKTDVNKTCKMKVPTHNNSHCIYEGCLKFLKHNPYIS